MMVPRAKATPAATTKPARDKQQKPQLATLLEARDFVGAMTLLEFNLQSGEADESTLPWMAYAAFHAGEYEKAADAITKMQQREDADPLLHTFLGVCYFYMGKYREAEKLALKVHPPTSRLQVRLLFHIAHRLNDENKLMQWHQKLQDATDDQLSLAAIHSLRGHYQEAIDVYKRVLMENQQEYFALNVYLALCYYKLDYYDVAAELLQTYISQQPNSIVAINLKACNTFRLYNGKAAETELKKVLDTSNLAKLYGAELLQHNLVVFRNGEGALQTLPKLLDVVPEARLNLAIYYLMNDAVDEAHALVKDMEPTSPQEYTIKGVVNAAIGQRYDNREALKLAQQYFQLVGSSASECDTIPGRQCMASCFFLMRSFDEVNLYLESIKPYFESDDSFNWNYALTRASMNDYVSAEQSLACVQNERFKQDIVYRSWLIRCYIHNKKPQLAWDLYETTESASDRLKLLQLVANDCYKLGSFYYAAKAFDTLERMDANPEYWEGKRGALVGVFQQIVAGRESRALLPEVMAMLRSTNNPQVEYIMRIIRKWEKER